jgi:hypothetical protein
MMLGRRPRASDDHAPSAQRGDRQHHRVGERIGDGQALPQEKLRQEDHETEDQSVNGDERPGADDHALEYRRAQHVHGACLRHRDGGRGRRQRAGALCHLFFDLRHQGFRLGGAPLRLQPARRLW